MCNVLYIYYVLYIYIFISIFFQTFVKWIPFQPAEAVSADNSSNSLDRNWLVSGDYLSEQTDDLMHMVFL